MAKIPERSESDQAISTGKTLLEPQDWDVFRKTAHQMVEDVISGWQSLAQGPVWRPMPETIRKGFQENYLPDPSALIKVYQDYLETIAPYAGGNRHPGFMGWVQGYGAPTGVLGEFLAASLNMNCGGRDHVGIALERQIALWVRHWFDFPQTSEGLFVTGTSMANFVAVLAARTKVLGPEVRNLGLADTAFSGKKLTAYSSQAAHGCVPRALEMAGFGRDCLRLIPLDEQDRMDTKALRQAIDMDKARGHTPFLLIGTAGSVDVGAFDDLDALADIAAEHHLWFHVDGAFGALGVHSKRLMPRLQGLSRAQSVAFDFHKWGHVPYDAGFVIVAEGEILKASFAAPAAYLSRETGGMAAEGFWPTDYGPDLSRGCRALKTWFVLRCHGVAAIEEAIDRGLDLASDLIHLIEAHSCLERVGSANLNIVCFRYFVPEPEKSSNFPPKTEKTLKTEKDWDQINRNIVKFLQIEGHTAPSLTRINGKIVIRAALFHPETSKDHLKRLVSGVLRFGKALCQTTLYQDDMPSGEKYP